MAQMRLAPLQTASLLVAGAGGGAVAPCAPRGRLPPAAPSPAEPRSTTLGGTSCGVPGETPALQWTCLLLQDFCTRPGGEDFLAPTSYSLLPASGNFHIPVGRPQAQAAYSAVTPRSGVAIPPNRGLRFARCGRGRKSIPGSLTLVSRRDVDAQRISVQ